MKTALVNGVMFYIVDGLVYLDPPARTKVKETVNRRGHVRVEYDEVKHPKVLKKVRSNLRRGSRAARTDKARPTPKVRRRLEKQGRKNARR